MPKAARVRSLSQPRTPHPMHPDHRQAQGKQTKAEAEGDDGGGLVVEPSVDLVEQRGAGVGFGLLAVIGPFAFALGPRIVIRADSRPCRFGPAALVDRPAAIDVGEIGRAHVWTPVTNAHLVCRLLLEKKNKSQASS